MRIQQVLERLGLPGSPSLDLEGLTQVYTAWCQRVPFDNVRKMIQLRTRPEAPLPGGHSGEFFDHFLNGGTGGTCWSSANALCELLQSLGFDARRTTASMFDMNQDNHGTTKVVLRGAGERLLDTYMLSQEPIPLAQTDFIGNDKLFGAEAEWESGSHLIWSHPPNMGPLPCRLMADSVEHAYYLSKYERSRTVSPFNQRLCARRNHPEKQVMLVGNTRYVKTIDGVEQRDLCEAELLRSLQEDIGMTAAVVQEWADSGSLASTMEPAAGPNPPEVLRRPPSRR
jgi:N-hydroxyarylamine O-acetyltransferase